MGRGIQGAVLKALGSQDHVMTVVGRERCAEHFIRIHFRSETLLQDIIDTPGSFIRGWFPDPDGGNKQFQRGYTIINADPAVGTFDIDFVIHQPLGPASAWALNCETGDELVVTRYGADAFSLLDPPPAGYLFLGDLAAYPAICEIVASIPEGQKVVVYLESHSEHDFDLPLPDGPNIEAAWVPELPDGQGLAQALAGRDWAGWYAWVTAEVLTTRRAKTLLQREFDINRPMLHAQAYWVRGKSMGRSRAAAQPTQPAQSAQTTSATQTTPQQQQPEPLLRPARRALIMGGIAQALVAVLEIMPFILFAEVARLFLRGGSRDEFVATSLVALLVMGVNALGTALVLFGMHYFDSRFEMAVRRRLLSKLTVLPLGWFGNRKAVDVKKFVSDDVASLHYLITHAVLDLVSAVVTPLVALGYLFVVQWRLSLVLLIPIAVFILVMGIIARRDKDKIAVGQRYTAQAAGQTQTYIATRDQAKIFGPTAIVDLPGSLRTIGRFYDDWQRETAVAKIQAIMINRPITVLGLLVCAGWLLLLPGWIAADDLVPFLILGTAFGGQLVGIGMNVEGLLNGLGARDELELLLGTPELAPPDNRQVMSDEYVCFSDVSFEYRAGHPVLRDFSLGLPSGTVTAIVGPSGAGKSTVAALLARLWDPQRGSVSIAGTDIRDLTATELYSKVTILLQDVQLIHGSIRDNIALTRPDATDAEVRAVAAAANIDQMIESLPQGYDTIVHTNRLSGGERQRIGIARALLADTPIVVLDEATAAADPDSEWAIRQGLDRLLAGKTVLMIAHRLHTIRHADRIVVLDEGTIVEQGTHAELVERGGMYATLLNVDSEGLGSC